jgi:hypothetical protein
MSRFKNIVVVDLCDTLAQVTKAIEGIFGPCPDPFVCFHPSVIKEFWMDPDNRIAQEIFKHADPLPGSTEGVRKIARSHQIVYLTARPEWARGISEKWLSQNGFPSAPVVCAQDKLNWVARNGAAWAIDDNPAQIKKLLSLVPVFVPSREWNIGLGKQFKWEELK